jgi:hypothetical protein
MPANTKRASHARDLSHGVLADVLDGRENVRPDRLDNESAERPWPRHARRFERAFGFAPGQAERQPAGG